MQRAGRILRARLFALVGVALVAGTVTVALASSTTDTLYPDGTKIETLRNMTNADIDQRWGQYPDGRPHFHLHSEDALGRLRGWGQTGYWTNQSQEMAWAIVYNHYSKSSAASAALLDFHNAANNGQFQNASTPTFVMPGGSGTQIAMKLHARKTWGRLYGIAHGTVEIEAVELTYQAGSKMRLVSADTLTRVVTQVLRTGQP